MNRKIRDGDELEDVNGGWHAIDIQSIAVMGTVVSTTSVIVKFSRTPAIAHSAIQSQAS